jgi:NTP pyrophosphatase (non-canonical NTP hydrolase)
MVDVTLQQVLENHAIAIEQMCSLTHQLNEKWWTSLETGAPIERNVGELLMLTVSELAEAMEGHRKNLADDHLPQRPMFEVELADALIRIMDMAQGLNFDLAGAWKDKMLYNVSRADHQIAHRQGEHGKKY